MAELADLQNEQNQEALAPDAPIGQQEPAERPEKAPKVSIRDGLKSAFKQAAEAENPKEIKDKPVEAKEAPEKSETKKDVQPKASEAVGLPPGWSKETKDFVASLPADHPLRKDVEKREREISDGFKKYSEKDKQYQELEKVVAPRRQNYQKLGLQDTQAIDRLFSWEEAIRGNPVEGIVQLAVQYNVNPAQLAQRLGINLNTGPQSETPDPLRPVYDQFGQLSQTVTSMQQELQNSRMERVSETLASFAKDSNHPHFEKVRVRMGQLIQAGVVPPNDLERAYQEAVWADPETRAVLTKEQFDTQEAERKAEQTRRAREARQAAISPGTRAPAGPVTNAKPGKQSVREALTASIKELQDQRA